jgi:uncharacterized membrane protein YozB (DUF420 family)
MRRGFLAYATTTAATIFVLTAITILARGTRFDYRDFVAGAIVLAAVLLVLSSRRS